MQGPNPGSTARRGTVRVRGRLLQGRDCVGVRFDEPWGGTTAASTASVTSSVRTSTEGSSSPPFEVGDFPEEEIDLDDLDEM